MKELVSIQVGAYAHFVGSHFWNLQDELLGLQSDPASDPVFVECDVCFDRLYRAGETPQGVATYTPRLLAINSRGSLGAVKAAGSLYEQTGSVGSTSVTSWTGQVSRHLAEPQAKNKFLQSLEDEELEWTAQQEGRKQNGSDNKTVTDEAQRSIVQNLEDSVQFWTDYSKVHFHPLSLYELEGVWHGVTPLDDFGSGTGLLRGLAKEEAIDRLRFFVEEADQLQGFQVLVDDSNGFAGIATDFLEAVVDEYDRSPVQLFTVRCPTSLQKPSTSYATTLRGLHDAISFSQLSNFTQCMIPLALSSFYKFSRYLYVDDRKDFHTSAVYASAISCITLPLRMRELSVHPLSVIGQTEFGGIDMANLIHLLMGHRGRKVSILDLSMPAPPLTGAKEHERADFSRFLPLVSDVACRDDEATTEVLVVQGSLLADSGKTASLMDVRNCYGTKSESTCHLVGSTCPLALPLPFPNFFVSTISTEKEKVKLEADISTTPVAARLRATADILPYLEERHQSLKNLSGGSLGSQIIEGWGMSKEDIRELVELNANVIAAYKNTEYLESDSD